MTVASLNAGEASRSHRPLATLAMIGWCGWFKMRRLAFGRVNSGVRRMWAARVAFYQTMWRAACAKTGTTIAIRANGDIEMRRCGLCLEARDNETYVDEPAAITRSGYKQLVHRLLSEAGIPVPKHTVVTLREYESALAYLRTSRGAVVVKPAALTGGGFGVTTNVQTPRALRSAMAWARGYGKDILIEDQIEGDCYRILIMDGEHIDSILRRPPTVVGDGRSTIRQLLHRENRRRVAQGAARSQVVILTDRDLINTLARQGLVLGSRPPAGAVVRLKQAINENALQDNSPATGLLCVEIIAAARKAAELVGLRLAGVDVICADPWVPLAKSGGVVLEVNAPPNLYYHHLDGRDGSVAETILNAYFDCRRKDVGGRDVARHGVRSGSRETQEFQGGGQ
jgi:D-alanine-D-alanine ligase-like ATP-grasp enzyme